MSDWGVEEMAKHGSMRGNNFTAKRGRIKVGEVGR